MSRFFIHRPIFAWVIALLIMLLGVLAVINLPVEQYPRIAPPTVTVSAVYPGASAETVEKSVTQVIEQQMTGLDGLMYLSSSSSSSGAGAVTLTFENGIDPDTAQVQVQNKLQSAMSSLPEAVQRQGLQVNKSASGFLMVYAFTSDDPDLTRTDISDYIDTNVVEQISRVEGVGSVQLFGSPYAMRIWLDPQKLRSYSLMPADVINAIRSQNVQVSAGQLGNEPINNDRAVINATVSVQSLFSTPDDFRNILLISDNSGAQVRLGDVADVELGSESYRMNAQYNGKVASGMAISLASGANALKTHELVQERMQALSANFPNGLNAEVAYDTTPFIRISIEQVAHTLIEAIVLVFLVMFLFLQNWRATIIPTLAVPVVLLGTFAVLSMLGFTINVLTMFAMVLAIGLLVDDAIVVVENVERIIEENPHISVKDATIQSMNEISKVVIGIALILSAVFVPMAFFSGSTGVIYRQFSITLVTSMALSAIVALIFTPALCATILKRNKSHQQEHRYQGMFGWFNKGFDKASQRYERFVGKSFHLKSVYLAIYAALVAGLVFLFGLIPSSFVPEEDQGILFTLVQLPAGTPLSQTEETLTQVRQYFEDQEASNVKSVFSVAGFSFAGQGSNMGLVFIRLKDWQERTDAKDSAKAVAGRAMGYFMQQGGDSRIFTLAPPPIQGLGSATGFDMMLKDNGGLGHDKLLAARNQLLGMASQNEQVVGVRPNGQEDAPEFKIHINQEQAASYGLSMRDITNVISTAWGSGYVNDFIDGGSIKRVYIQGNSDSRVTPDDINKWYVRNDTGNMIPFDAFSSGEWRFGSPALNRYNGVPAMNIQGNAATGLSTGDAMTAMEHMVANLPEGIGYEWTGLSLEEKKSGDQAPLLYALSIIVVFLCLAALYESWTIPFSVLLVVPLGVLGALVFTWMRDFANDIYLQVGLLTIVGLSAKNAILIIEFAKEHQEAGNSLKESVMTAAKQRLRPIIMTSLAFGIGVVPLYFSSGAGSGSQQAIGTSVLGGVISATLLGVFFIPMFYVWVRSIFPYKGNKHNNHVHDMNG